MGALLAIPSWTNIDSLGLESEPGRQLAWTLQNYGAYIVDDTYGPTFTFNAENGADGSKKAEFWNDWGLALEIMGHIDSRRTAWQRDIQRLMAALYVVDNNSARPALAGGGIPRQPLAPAISPP
ncbi:MAG: hypothetical protein Q8P89_04040 [bacterium]|nr:hypothetical protein [bacterium]